MLHRALCEINITHRTLIFKEIYVSGVNISVIPGEDATDVYQDMELGGFHIPKGAIMITGQYSFQNNPKYWPDADKFMPERFLDQSVGDMTQWAPFGDGGRSCIGSKFAMEEAKVGLSLVETLASGGCASDLFAKSPQLCIRTYSHICLSLKTPNAVSTVMQRHYDALLCRPSDLVI